MGQTRSLLKSLIGLGLGFRSTFPAQPQAGPPSNWAKAFRPAWPSVTHVQDARRERNRSRSCLTQPACKAQLRLQRLEQFSVYSARHRQRGCCPGTRQLDELQAECQPKSRPQIDGDLWSQGVPEQSSTAVLPVTFSVGCWSFTRHSEITVVRTWLFSDIYEQ